MPKRVRTAQEREFAKIDAMAKVLNLEDLRPMSAAQSRAWREARNQSRGKRVSRPVATLIALDEKLLKKLDKSARDAGVSRSRYVADSLRRRMGKAG